MDDSRCFWCSYSYLKLVEFLTDTLIHELHVYLAPTSYDKSTWISLMWTTWIGVSPLDDGRDVSGLVDKSTEYSVTAG
jgi:hypothetical protein